MLNSAFAALHSLLPSFVQKNPTRTHIRQRLSAGVCKRLKLPNCQTFKKKLSESLKIMFRLSTHIKHRTLLRTVVNINIKLKMMGFPAQIDSTRGYK